MKLSFRVKGHTELHHQISIIEMLKGHLYGEEKGFHERTHVEAQPSEELSARAEERQSAIAAAP